MNFQDFDLRSYLESIGISYWEEGANVGRGWVGIKCVFCPDHHNHLGINLTYKSFSCWKCGATGSLITLIQELEGISYQAAIETLGEFQSIIHKERFVQKRLQDVGSVVLPSECLADLTPRQKTYLDERRFDAEDLKETWGILAGPVAGPWKHRIIIPVTMRGEVVTWVGMDVAGNIPKYKAAPAEQSYLPASELVYGADQATGPNVLVVEGVTDAWRIGPGTVALLGMQAGSAKRDHLISMGMGCYFIMLDGEPLAQKNASILAKELSNSGLHVEILELDPGRDPDNLTDQKARDLRKELNL